MSFPPGAPATGAGVGFGPLPPPEPHAASTTSAAVSPATPRHVFPPFIG